MKQTEQTMKERVEELAEQAGFFGCMDEGAGLVFRKFAQLIVEECANIDFRHKVGMTTDQEFDTSRVILEHFGVQE